jgi:hypothetical protein
MTFLELLQENPLSTSVRESLLMYPIILTLHGIGMGFLVGLNAMLDLRLLGFAPAVPLPSMERFFPVMWAGLAINAVTGLILLAASATTLLTDPVMYFKLTMVAAALVVLGVIRGSLGRFGASFGAARARGAALGAASLTFWTLAIVAGRLTAYTFFRFWN